MTELLFLAIFGSAAATCGALAPIDWAVEKFVRPVIERRWPALAARIEKAIDS